MLKDLILPFSIYRLKLKLNAVQSRIKKLETVKYLDLEHRKELSQLKKMQSELHEHETAIYFHLSV